MKKRGVLSACKEFKYIDSNKTNPCLHKGLDAKNPFLKTMDENKN
jgi:hypothetical protein